MLRDGLVKNSLLVNYYHYVLLTERKSISINDHQPISLKFILADLGGVNISHHEVSKSVNFI